MTASTDTTPAATKSSSRRALLAGALGGIGAVAAGAMAKVSPVRGANGDPFIVGTDNSATSRTRLINSTPSSAFSVESTGGGIAVTGSSNSSVGIRGASGPHYGVHGTSSSSFGVYGQSNSNVAVAGISYASDKPAVLGYATSNSTGLLGSSGTSVAAKPKTGVYGYANQDASSKGVFGFSGRGVGVYAQANKAGYALQTNGRIKASKVSGVASIVAGNTTVTVSPNVKVTSGSFVLLTPKANIGSRGLWYSTNASADSITIHHSSSRSGATKIAWLLMG